MSNRFGFKKEYKHRELDFFAFDKGISPRKQNRSDACLYIILAVLVLLVAVLHFFIEPYVGIPVAHAADTVQVPMTDIQTYRFWDGQTKQLCNTYLAQHHD